MLAPCKRNYWTDEEVEAMLQIILDKRLHSRFKSKRQNTKEMYNIIYLDMVAKGFLKKDNFQIRNKWKSLKSAYCLCIKENRSDCEFFEKLHEILTGTHATSGTQSHEDNEDEDSDEEQESLQMIENVDTEVIVDIDTNPLDIESESQEASSSSTRKKLKTGKTKPVESGELKIFMEHQRNLMEMFFRKQEDQDKAARKRQSEEMKTILKSFTTAIDRLITSPTSVNPQPPYPYPYPVFTMPPQPMCQHPNIMGSHQCSMSSNVGRNSDNKNELSEKSKSGSGKSSPK